MITNRKSDEKKTHRIVYSTILVACLMIILTILPVFASLDVKPIQQGQSYPDVSIDKSFIGIKLPIWLGGGTIANTSLKDNSKGACSSDCYAEGTTTYYTDGNSLFDLISFYKKNVDGEYNVPTSIKDYRVYLQDGTKTVDNYEEVCVPSYNKEFGDTKLCSMQLEGTKQIPNWVEYTSGELKAGTYNWRIEGEKDLSVSIDWTPTIYGYEIKSWAVWGGSSTLTQDLKAYYTFNGTAVKDDYLGRYNGTTAGTTTGVDGKIGKAFNYTTSSYSFINYSLIDYTKNFTYNFWINKELGVDAIRFFNFRNDSLIIIATDEMVAGDHRLEVYFGGNWYNTGMVFTSSTWYMISLAYNGTSMLVYKNGTLIYSTLATAGAPDTYGNSLGGNGPLNGNNNNLKGAIDELGVWNRTLTSAELVSLYNSNAGLDVSTIASSGNVYLVTPANGNVTYTSSITFNCSAVVSGATLTNMSLWTNQSGTWAWNRTNIVTGTSNSTTFTNTYPDGKFGWSCVAGANDGSSGWATENRTVEYNVTSTVSLISPVDDYNTISNSLTFNCSASLIGSTIKNITLWTNFSGTWAPNKSNLVYGDSNSTTFTNTYTLKDFDWTCKMFDNSAGYAWASTNRTVSISSHSINNVTYSASTYDTKYESFLSNVTLGTGTVSSAYLNYNNTLYLADVILDGSNNILSYSMDIPIVTSTVNNNFSFIFSNGTTNFTTLNYTQSVAPINLFYCPNVTANVSYLKFDYQDESTFAVINGTIPSSTFTYYIGSGSLSKTYTYSNSSATNPSYNFCFTPESSNINYTLSMYYSNADYRQRSYSASGSLSNITTNVTLSLLNLLDGNSVTFQTVTQAGTAVSNVTVTALRDVGGVMTAVETGETDDAGTITFFLNSNYDHFITTSKSGYIATSVLLRPTQSSYMLMMTSTSASNSTYTFTKEGIKYQYGPGVGILAPGNYTFWYNVTSSKSNLVNCKFELTNTIGTILATNSSACTSGAYLTIQKEALSGDRYFGSFYVDIGDGYMSLEDDGEWYTLEQNTSTVSLKSLLGYLGTTSNWACTNSSDPTCLVEQKKWEYTKIVTIFLLLAIIMAYLNVQFQYDSNNPGITLFALPFIVWILSISAGLNGEGLFYIADLTKFHFLDNYVFAFFATLISATLYMKWTREGR